MKKCIISIFFLIASLILAPFSYTQVSAETSVELNTIYPEDVLDYTNLTNISSFAVSEDYIAYTLDRNTLTIFNIDTKQYRNIAGFNNILDIKFSSTNIIIADQDSIRYTEPNSTYDSADKLNTLSDISLDSLQALDMFVSDNRVLIATICDKIFKLYEFDHNLISSKTNPVKTSTHNKFNTAYLLTINANNAFIVYKTNVEYGTTGLCIQNYASNEPIVNDNFIPNVTILDNCIYEDSEYILTFTNEIFHLLTVTGDTVYSVNIENQDKNITDHFPILKITDIEFYNEKIYISDCAYKTIQTFSFLKDNSAITLKSNEIIMCSSSNDKGRFNNVQDIYIQGSTIFTADTGNNRIHYIKDNQSYFINGLEIDSDPNSIILDKFNNMYFIKNNATGSILCKYTPVEDSYKKANEYNTINTTPIGFVSDMCVTNSNNIYLLDYTNNKLVYMSTNGLEANYQLLVPIDSNSEIKYLKGLDLLVLLNNSTIHLMNQKGSIISSLSLTNCTEITVDVDKIYARCDDQLHLIEIQDNTPKLASESIIIPNSDNITNLTFDIINRRIIAFDQFRSCLVTFDCNLSDIPFVRPNIEDTTPLNSSSTILPLNIKYSTLIYDYPFEIGNFYNDDQSIEKCIGIGEYQNYYQILFNHNNELHIGYIPKGNVETIDYTYNPISVITTHKDIPIYKYPTILQYNDERIITDTIDINTKLTLSYAFPISIDSKTFYLLKQQNNIGFIFSVDVVLDENTNIKNLNTENATIKILDNSSAIPLYQDDYKTEILRLQNGTRIYVENFDKDSTYTKVIYKDKNLETKEGYIETKYIQMDDLDNNQIALIIIIIISILLLILIAITYIVIKKKRK